MPFLGFEIAKSGMNSARYNIDIAGHNITNVNTPGYSRQVGIQTTKVPVHSIGILDSTNISILGTGSEIQTIERVRNDFIDGEYRDYLSKLNYNNFMTEGYGHVEKILNEPSAIGISAHMSSFWNSLSELSSQTSDISARTAFTQSALSFTTLLNTAGDKLNHLKSQYSEEANSIVSKINGLTSQIYELNKNIKDMELSNNPANDLRDTRDNLIDELSSMVDIQTFEDESGGISVLSGGRLLVGMDIHREIELQSNPTTKSLEVVWSEENQPFKAKNGHIQAVLDTMNSTIKDIESNLNTIATNISNKFNEIHKQGFDLNGNKGEDFFVSSTADPISIHNITINPNIIKNDSLLALSSEKGLDGDNKNLKALLSLKDTPLINHSSGKNIKIDEFYNYTVTKLGSIAASHKQAFENSKHAIDLLQKEKASISSVSMDEETANLIQAQHAFNASAKVMKTCDEMLATLIDLA